jgi:4-amino-4-deoxy-L-arabinose transferase-like glycosyltransferase
MDEPSVLDYIKAKLMPWRGIKISIPPAPERPPQIAQPAADQPFAEESPIESPEKTGQAAEHAEYEAGPEEDLIEPPVLVEELANAVDEIPQATVEGQAAVAAVPANVRTGPSSWPMRTTGAVVVALLAQLALEPDSLLSPLANESIPRNPLLGIALYAVSAAFLIWAILSKEWALAPLAEDRPESVSVGLNWKLLLPAVPLIIISFLAFGGNTFNAVNLFLWAITIIYVFAVLWQPVTRSKAKGLNDRLLAWIKKPEIHIRITPWVILILLGTALVIFFRFYRLDQVPGEMFSDHAEKLLDVSDILNGKFSIFFPRNTGREAIQMYLSASIAILLNTGLSFITLKIGTVLCGVLTLPYVYLLGKEIGGKWVGFLAFVMTGISYWPDLIARIGLRFPLYPLFAAPAFYYLILGLRRQKRNYFILSGLFLGLGLHGYTPSRIVPFIFVVLIGLYLLHRQASGKRLHVLAAFFILILVTLVIFLPLARYAQENPDMFNYRTITRLGSAETPLPGPFLDIFISNTVKAYIMPFWDDGDTWVHSVVGRPSLDVVAAALYFLGTLQVLVRYLRKRHWIDMFLLVSVPLFMAPSILSLAFPSENPSLNRTGAAYIPVFIMAAIGLEGFLSSFRRLSNRRSATVVAGVLGLALIGWSASTNYYLVQVKFDNQFMNGAWNTSQIGAVIRGFADSIGTPDSAYVIPFPYWVDTRLVGINAGYPTKDYALNRDKLPTTLDNPLAKLFIFKSDDKDTETELKKLYPNGTEVLHTSIYQGKDFMVFSVPPSASGVGQNP